MTTLNIRRAATALLDTPGVHPGDDRWHSADEVFWSTLRSHDSKTLDDAANAALDHLGVDGAATRIEALANFHNGLVRETVTTKATKTVKSGAKSIAQRVKNNASQLAGKSPKKTRNGGE